MNLITINNETILPIVLYGKNRSTGVLEYHKKVMVEKFGFPMNYIEAPFPMVSHGTCANQMVLSTIDTIKPTYYWLCDFDSIFLKKYTFNIMYDTVKFKNAIWGQATQSNHKKGPNQMIPHAYASQGCLCFPTELYDKLGRPNLDHYSEQTEEFGGDTCELLTYAAKENGYIVSLVYPSHSIVSNSELDNGCIFGRGNTYGIDLMYHQMQNDSPLSAGEFIAKCQEVLDRKYE